MTLRYFVEQLVHADRVELRGAEAHHAQHVMRASVGQQVTVFDGSGREFRARIDALERSSIRLTVVETLSICREASRRIVVGVALPKGDRQRWLIEKLTELGVSQVVPLRCERSSVHPDSKSLQKLARTVIEASKQCGRNQLLQISPLADWQTYLSAAPATAVRLVADPTGTQPAAALRGPGEVYLAVGPEGGFSPDERAAASAMGWHCVTLGPRLLRIETACLVLAALAADNLAADNPTP